MLEFKLNELIKEKEKSEGKRLSDAVIADAIGMSRQTVSKIRNAHITNYITTTDVVDKLLTYFNCESITDLVEYNKPNNTLQK